MSPGGPAKTNGFVLAADEGQPFWFLNTLAINKVGAEDSGGRLSIVDHQVPAGFAPPAHIHEDSDEVLLIMEGEFTGFCGDRSWSGGPGALVFMPHGIPHGFTVSDAGPGRIIVVESPGGFDQFVAAVSEPAHDMEPPEPTPPDLARITQLAAAHGIRILPPSEPQQP